MISRISSIISSHATGIPSDEGRVYGLVRRVAQSVSPVLHNKDTYSEFAGDRFPELAQPKKRDLATNSLLHGYGMTLFSVTLQKIIIRA
jgi:hypothetical protein